MSSTASRTRSPLDYIDIPPAAMLLQSTTPLHRSLQPAPKITTSLPTPSPPFSQTTRQRSASLIPSPSISALPQLLLSSALPGGVTVPGQTPTSPTFASTSGSPAGAGASNPRKKISAEPVQLLSTRDPLSLPIMSVNFRRFVSCVGPVFWLQDRIEEIVMWKKGWTVTCAWLLAYGFFCYFPHLLLCLPHTALIAIILATYPYSTNNAKDSGVIASVKPDQPPPPEGSIPWQANIHGIQNLMGIFSDLMDFVKPYVYHLRLTPAHLYADMPSNIQPTSIGTHSSSPAPATPTTPTFTTTTTTTTDSSPITTPPRPSAVTSPKLRSSPYTPHILTLLLVTLPPLVYIVSLPAFPLRLVIFLAGTLPIICLHPWAINVLLPTTVIITHHIWNSPLPEHVVNAIQRVKVHKKWFESRSGRKPIEMVFSEDSEETLIVGKSKSASLKMVVERVVDDERLSDVCWQSEMREVELWENERYVGPTLSESLSTSPSLEFGTSTSRSSLTSLTSFGSMGNLSSSPQRARKTSRGAKGSWNKGHLRPSERGPWTRRRDGWSGSDYGRGQENGVEVEGQVNSLTFPLAPGWAFIETEDWRKDVVAEWAVDECGGGDEDGWVYTNDAWFDPQRSPFGRVLDEKGESDAGGGPYVTRRRRWLRRVWNDPGSTPRF